MIINCLSDLRERVSNQQKQIDELKTSKRTQEEQINELKANVKRLQDQELNEHQRQIHNLQQQVNKLQQHIESLQKQQQFLAQQQNQLRSQSPCDEDDCECESCEPQQQQPRSCLYASNASRKRPGSWKDIPPVKRSPSFGKPNGDHCYERSTSSPYGDIDYTPRHNHCHHSSGSHHHQHLSPLSPLDESYNSSQLHQQLITFYGAVITVNVGDDETVESVKSKIEMKEGIPGEQMLLFFAGQQLEDDKTLCFYSINSESSRHLVLRLINGMKIFVKTLSDKTIEVLVDPNETIEIVKVKIHEQEGISPCDQRLLLDGRDLADLRTLSDYGIKHRSTLQLDLHLGGPCPICQTQFKNINTGKGKGASSSSTSSSSSGPSHHGGGKHD